VAAEFCEQEVFQRIMNFVKENVTKEDVHKLLLVTDNKGRAVFHLTPNFGRSRDSSGKNV
jgi:hypothetical protein